jgi:deoxyxylulose-5-phosphate synthase
MRWVKPLDEAMILSLVEQHELLITLEENAIAGGAGSGSRRVSSPMRVSSVRFATLASPMPLSRTPGKVSAGSWPD